MSDTLPAADSGSPFSLRRDRFTLLMTSGVILVLFAVGAAVQSAAIYQLRVSGAFPASNGTGTLTARLIANAVGVLVALAVGWLVALERRKGIGVVAALVLVCLCAAAARFGFQAVLVYPASAHSELLIDFVAAFVIVAIAFVLGFVFVAAARKLRAQELAYARQELRAAAALAALQAEELRVRREVAEGLHGTVQQSLVLLGARIDDIADRLQARATPAVEGASSTAEPLGTTSGLRTEISELRVLAEELDILREGGVRTLSQLLYPAGIELGLGQAARLMMQRLPESIAVEVQIDDAVFDTERDGSADPSTREAVIARRLLVLRTLEEGISNALRHGRASGLRLHLLAPGDGGLALVFDDNGTGLPSAQPQMNGLGLLSERISAVGGRLELAGSDLGGAKLVVSFPAAAIPDSGDRAG